MTYQRGARRLDIDLSARLKVCGHTEEIDGQILDISPLGFKFSTVGLSPYSGDRIELRVSSTRRPAVVRWARRRNGGYEIGCEFENPSNIYSQTLWRLFTTLEKVLIARFVSNDDACPDDDRFLRKSADNVAEAITFLYGADGKERPGEAA